jgi:hypothetical protein
VCTSRRRCAGRHTSRLPTGTGTLGPCRLPEGGKRKPERKFRAPRPLTAQQRALGFASEPEQPARARSQKPKARRAKQSQLASGEGGWLVGVAAAAVVAAEVRGALQAARRPPAPTRQAPAGAGPPVSRSPLAGTTAERPRQYGRRPQPARRTPSRTATSIAKLSCQHTARLRGRPSQLPGRFVECPRCGVNVTVVEAEPTRDIR